MTNQFGRSFLFFLAGLFAVLAPTTALSADAETYFKGKTIRFVTGSRPGGGTDILLRYMASNWGKFVPGNPRFVVTNMPPHVHGLNFVWRGKADGLTIFMHSTGVLREQTLQQAEFKTGQFKYVGDIGDRSFVLTGYNLPYRDIREAMGKKQPELRYVDQIPSAADMNAQAFQLMLLAEWLNLPIKFGVIGERGTAIQLLEMERGNMNITLGGAGRWFGWPKLRPGWVAQGKLRPLLDMTFFGRQMKGNAEFKDVDKVPHVYKLLNKEQREIWTALIEAPQAMNKPLVLSPKTPDEIVNIYRKALEDAMNDKKFREGIERVTGIPATWVKGEELHKEAIESERLWSRYQEQETKLRQEMYKKYIGN
jgi:tripartite-type tricarboxylate transporter receptor subunit TctC